MHVILYGGSKTVYYLARQFVRNKVHVVVLNPDVTQCRELASQTKATVVVGDGTDINRLEEAGARMADAFLALTHNDQDNFIACQIANRKFGVPRTIALVNDPDNEEIFTKLGVTVAFSATRVIGQMLESETSFADVHELMPLMKGRVTLTDVHLPRNAPAVGMTLNDLPLSGNTLIGCIVRGEEVIVPSGSTVLQADDHVLVISDVEHHERDLEAILG